MDYFEKEGCVGGQFSSSSRQLARIVMMIDRHSSSLSPPSFLSYPFTVVLSAHSLIRIILQLAFWLAESNHAFSLQAYNPDGHAAARVSSYSLELSQGLHF